MGLVFGLHFQVNQNFFWGGWGNISTVQLLKQWASEENGAPLRLQHLSIVFDFFFPPRTDEDLGHTWYRSIRLVSII